MSQSSSLPPSPDPSMHQDIDHILIDADALRRRVCELGAAISQEYKGRDLLLVSVLKGSIVFMADLIRAISIAHEIDFMATSSYGSGVTSSGAVRPGTAAVVISASASAMYGVSSSRWRAARSSVISRA